MKQLIIWLSLIAIYIAWWWYHLSSFLLWELWNSPLSNVLLSIIGLWAMWWCHENLGWFEGRPSESDAPRMHYHPTDDRP